MKPTRLSLAFTLALAFSTAARAQTVAPNPAPTIITTVPYTISKAGYYQLGANLAGTSISGNLITIAADNVVLDFAGHYISGPANPSSNLQGVYSNNHNNLTVINGKIASCRTGINFDSLSSPSNNLIERVQNMVITHCFYAAINLSGVTGGYVLDNHFCFIGNSPSDAFAYGIYVDGGSGIRVSNNDFLSITAIGSNATTAAYGVYTDSDSTFAIGNTFTACDNSINGGKYANNLTSGTTGPTGGTNAGGNN